MRHDNAHLSLWYMPDKGRQIEQPLPEIPIRTRFDDLIIQQTEQSILRSILFDQNYFDRMETLLAASSFMNIFPSRIEIVVGILVKAREGSLTRRNQKTRKMGTFKGNAGIVIKFGIFARAEFFDKQWIPAQDRA